MTVQAYPGYRESGVLWIGAIPVGWSALSFKTQFQRNDGGAWGVDPEGIYDTVVLRSTEQTSSGHWRIEDPASRRLTTDEIKSTLLVEGDLLITKSSGSTLHIGKTTIVNHEVASLRPGFSNFMQRIRMNEKFSPKLAWYIFNSELARAQFDFLSNTTTGLANLNASTIGEVKVPIAPVAEQAAIVCFLDRETGKIDALVAEQKRLITLLKEKRQAVISKAVTKGLNPSASLKDSGVPWLGEVPAHWDVRSISSLTNKITNGYVGPTRDILVDDGIRYLQSLHIKQNKISFHTPYYVTPKWSAQHAKSILSLGDVLVVQTGDVGQAAVVTQEFAGCNCHALIILAPKSEMLTGNWLSWVLNSPLGQQTLASIQTGALHPHLNCGDVKDIRVPLPPLSEQEKIAEKIEIDCENFAQLEAEATRAIALLRERRAALISAAVTGKIDVRDAVTVAEAA